MRLPYVRFIDTLLNYWIIILLNYKFEICTCTFRITKSTWDTNDSILIFIIVVRKRALYLTFYISSYRKTLLLAQRTQRKLFYPCDGYIMRRSIVLLEPFQFSMKNVSHQFIRDPLDRIIVRNLFRHFRKLVIADLKNLSEQWHWIIDKAAGSRANDLYLIRNRFGRPW